MPQTFSCELKCTLLCQLIVYLANNKFCNFQFAGMFTLLPYSVYDYQINAYNDSHACQNLKSTGAVTIGKMLGGTSNLNHMMYVSPTESDYYAWADAANDSSWSFPYMAKYFAKGERIQDADVLAQNTSLHGTSGPTLIKRQLSSTMDPLIAGYEELGLSYKNDSYGQCTNQPLLNIGDDGIFGTIRQSGSMAYLRKINNTNVHIRTGATVTKVIFDNTTATGVQFTYLDTTYTVNVSKEVILAGGAIKTPQLLMISGVGDADVLTGLGITPVVNLTTVGQNLLDHVAAPFVIALDNATASTASVNYQKWPVPMITAYSALTPNESVTLQTIALAFGPAASGFLQLCTNGFKYQDKHCDAWYEYNQYRNIYFMVPNLMSPISTGSVSLNTTSIFDDPIVKMNLLSNSTELKEFAALLNLTAQVINTESLQGYGAEFVFLDVCSNYTYGTMEFMECYALAMSSTMWHYSGTCAMGSVVDNNLKVIGTEGLRVIDASVMPTMITGNIQAGVMAVGEKGSDSIKIYYGYDVTTDT